MLNLKNVTLLGLDCVNLDRLKIARDICVKDIEFGAVKLLKGLFIKKQHPSMEEIKYILQYAKPVPINDIIRC